jgi:hypothetical protein
MELTGTSAETSVLTAATWIERRQSRQQPSTVTLSIEAGRGFTFNAPLIGKS